MGPDSNSYDICVIGGGIIGLATGLRLTQELPALRVAVLEKEPEVARHQTGHNSGVIHAGIYYAPDTQKASFCAEGASMLRRYCDDRGIEYKMCGKVIVATTESEVPGLAELYRRGVANGVAGLELVGRERLLELEPHAAGVRGLHSPNTGIIDYYKVAAALAVDFRDGGGDLLTHAGVGDVARRNGLSHLQTTLGDLTARYVINCAGLHADRVARMMGVDPGVRIVPFRGEYFSLRPDRAYLVRGLIYPVPNPRLPFLGVHFTRRISGQVEAGPNAVLAFSREGYRKTDFKLADAWDALTFPGFWRMARTHWLTALREESRSLVKRVFLRSLQRLVPEVSVDDLSEPGAGVRAQAVGRDGRLVQDFHIAEAPGAIHVLNAPSPGATSCLAIGRHIVDRAKASFGLGV